MKFFQHYQNVLQRMPLWLLLTIITWAFIRGFALHPEPYGLSQYLYTYEEGFLIRGLVGSLFNFLVGPSPIAIKELAVWTSLPIYIGFIVVLIISFHKLTSMRERESKTDKLLFLVLISGPLLVGISATRGYHDTLILTLGLISYLSLRAEKPIQSLLWMSLALLIHEQVVFFILPFMGLHLWLQRHSHDQYIYRLETLVLILLAALTVIVIWQGQADARQALLLVEKIELALETDFFETWSDPYLTLFPAHNDVLHSLSLDNLPLILQANHLAMLATSVIFWLLGMQILIGQKKWADSLMFSFACLLPHTIYLVAWDVYRYLGYASMTSFFLLMEVRRHNPHKKALSPAIIMALSVFIAAQLSITTYRTVWVNARNSVPLYEIMRVVVGPESVPPCRIGTSHP